MPNNTHCAGCAFLFIIEGKRPMCLLKARWVGGALRSRVDVRGIMAAEMRNAFNNCNGKRLFALRSVAMKRFMLASLQEKMMPLKAYPMVEEQDTTAEYRERLRAPVEETDHDEEDSTEEDSTDEEFVEDEQIIRPEEEEPDGGDPDADTDTGDSDADGEPGQAKE